MNPVMLHRELSSFSSSPNVKVVLHRRDDFPVSNEATSSLLTHKVGKAIKSFIRQFDKLNVIDLKKLRKPSSFFAIRSGLRRDNILTTVEKTIEAAIQLTEKKDPLRFLYPVEIALVHRYCSMEDSINLSLAGTDISSEVLADSIATATLDDIHDFVTHARERFKSDCHFSKNILKMFFQHASEAQQEHFFSLLVNQDDLFFSHIISALPNDITHLTLGNYIYIKDHHVKEIAHNPRMTHLRSLDLSRGFRLTDLAIQAIAGSSYMASLQCLDLFNCFKLTDLTVQAIASSSHMAGLKSLNLSFCLCLTNLGVQAIVNSPHIGRLQNLELLCSIVDDETIKAITAQCGGVIKIIPVSRGKFAFELRQILSID